MKDVVIFGAGGHASVIFDILGLNKKVKVTAFSSPSCTADFVLGIKIISLEEALNKYKFGIVAIGENFIRSKVVDDILKINPDFQFINAFHPTAIISKNVEIGVGSVVCAGAIINPNSIIHEHVIINTGSIIEHDCLIKKFANISPGSVLGGGCEIGVGALVGIGSTVIHRKKLADYAVCGAHSLVTRDLGESELHFGSPCRFKRKIKWGEKIL